MTIGKVKRETTAVVNDRGVLRHVVVTVHVNGTIGLRAKGTQREYYLNAATQFRRLEQADAESENGVSVAPCRNPQRRIGGVA